MAEPETTEMVTTTQPEAEKALPESSNELEAIRAALKKANAEAAKYRKAAEAAEAEQKAKAEAEMTELQKTQKRLAEIEAKARDLELSQLRRTVGDKHALPAEIADLLKGSTAEEMEEHAKQLAGILPKAAQKPTGAPPTNPGQNGSQGVTREQLSAFLLRGGESPFKIGR